MSFNTLKNKEQNNTGKVFLKDICENIKNKIFMTLNKKYPMNNFTKQFTRENAEKTGKHILSSIYNNNSFEVIGQSGKKLVFKTINEETGEIGPHVIKINMQHVFEKIFQQIGDSSIKIDTDMEENDQKELKRFDDLSPFFDEKHILKPKTEKKEFIITSKELIDEIIKKAGLEGKFHGNEIRIEVPYITKPTAMEKIENKYVSFNFDYTPGAFKRYLGLDLNNNKSHDLPVTGKQVKEYLNKRFDNLIEQIKTMKNDSKPIIKLFEGIINFTEKHNEIMDIYGFDNFTFFMDKDNNLDFHLLDPIHPANIDKTHPEYQKWGMKYIPLNDKRFEGIESKKMDFNTYSYFAYPYIIEKMKTYIKENE